MDIGDPVKTTIEEISKILNIGNVVGKPIENNEIMLIPITKMGMGFGVGMGEGKEERGRGAGAGGCAGIEPTAMVVISKGVIGPEGVKIMYLKAPDPLTRAIAEIGNTAVKIMEKDQ
ncbi:MAG TPA: spore germination protein GerW family protein, partial [Methanobacterium sp.]